MPRAIVPLADRGHLRTFTDDSSPASDIHSSIPPVALRAVPGCPASIHRLDGSSRRRDYHPGCFPVRHEPDKVIEPSGPANGDWTGASGTDLVARRRRPGR